MKETLKAAVKLSLALLVLAPSAALADSSSKRCAGLRPDPSARISTVEAAVLKYAKCMVNAQSISQDAVRAAENVLIPNVYDELAWEEKHARVFGTAKEPKRGAVYQAADVMAAELGNAVAGRTQPGLNAIMGDALVPAQDPVAFNPGTGGSASPAPSSDDVPGADDVERDGGRVSPEPPQNRQATNPADPKTTPDGKAPPATTQTTKDPQKEPSGVSKYMDERKSSLFKSTMFFNLGTAAFSAFSDRQACGKGLDCGKNLASRLALTGSTSLLSYQLYQNGGTWGSIAALGLNSYLGVTQLMSGLRQQDAIQKAGPQSTDDEPPPVPDTTGDPANNG